MWITRTALALCAVGALAACEPAVPDSGAGVGFGNYGDYLAQREAELRGRQGASLPPASAISSEPLSAVPVSAQPLDAGTSARVDPAATGSDNPEDIARETQAALNASALNSGVPPLQASPSNPAPEAVGSFGISRENDFDAVDAQRSIEADKQRMAQVRAQYEQVQPTALPSRTDTGPNLVSYALQTTNQPGQQLYRRVTLGSQSRYARNCGKYPSPDLAQSDFLKSGGPEKDRKGLDPDGDGFACSWDPRPFRAARGG